MHADTRRIGVLTLTPNLGLGGGENRILAFSKAVDRARFNIHVVTVNEPHARTEEELGTLRPEFEAAGIPVHTLGAVVREKKSVPWRPDHLLRKFLVLYQLVINCRQLIREHHIDVLDTHGQDAAFVAFFVSFVCRVRLVATLYHPGETRSAYWLGKFFLMRFHAIVTDSVAKKIDIVKWIAGRPHVHVIYNGIEPPQSDRSQEDIERDLGLAGVERRYVIGQVGRLVRFKGQMTLLQAARQVLDRHPDAFFIIVGHASRDPKYLVELQQLASDLQITSRVHIGGYNGAVGDVWRMIDIHTHASHFDSLPNAILEGMCFGKPAVVTDVGGVTEIVLHEQTGIVVPPRDAKALADGLIRLIDDPTFANELGNAAKARFDETCRNDIITEQIETLLEGLAGA